MAAKRLFIPQGEEDQVMFEMEENEFLDDAGSEPPTGSSEYDRRLLKNGDAGKARSYGCCRLVLIHILIILIFLLLLFATYQASSRFRRFQDTNVLSNGTSNFLPTTVLVSLDGFRADFIHRGLTPTLNSFIAEGVSPPYMLPSFPSLTFPNHFTLVTGLYPESHGIVGNTFWDPNLKEEFYYTNQTSSMQAKWWNGEPLWMTAEKQGVKTGIHMWPGSEAHIGGVEPTYLDKYNGTEKLARKVDRILELLDLPGHDEPEASILGQRPQLIAAYVPVVDADGHKYGPNSTEIRNTIARVDDMLHSLLKGLEERNLTGIVNIVVVSDHGMATTSTDRLIQLDDLIDPNLIEHIDGWPLYGLRPKKPEDLKSLHDRLSTEAADNPHYKVYLKDQDMPENYHFSRNDRIAPLWIVPETGWAIVTKAEFDVQTAKASGKEYHPKGLHGYNHEDPLMRAIFVARGPAFPHRPNSRLDVFQNIEVYNIVCDSLSIPTKANNGTLHLPLRPVGLHSDQGITAVRPPEDPPLSSIQPSVSPSKKPSLGMDQPDIEPIRPVAGDESTNPNSTRINGIQAFWDSVISKVGGLKDWFNGVLSSEKEGKSSSGAAG